MYVLLFNSKTNIVVACLKPQSIFTIKYMILGSTICY